MLPNAPSVDEPGHYIDWLTNDWQRHYELNVQFARWAHHRPEASMLCLGSRCSSFVVALAATLFSVPAFAQNSTARIVGVVRDSAGVPREAATVRVTNNATAVTRSTSTRADGSYSISGLTPGVYTVAASLIGFRRTTRTDVQVDQETTVDLVMAPLPLQAITVTATLREEHSALSSELSAPWGDLIKMS